MRCQAIVRTKGYHLILSYSLFSFLGISKRASLIELRRGPDGKPGLKDYDDDSDNLILSSDGIEMTLAVNHLAPFLLTMLLLNLLKASVPARIVNVASSSHKMIKSVDIENLQGDINYDGYTAYSLSKLGNIFFTQSLSEILIGTGVTANALHPGVVDTKLLRKSYNLDGILHQHNQLLCGRKKFKILCLN